MSPYTQEEGKIRYTTHPYRSKSQVPLPIDALTAQLQAELQVVKNEQEAMLWKFTAMTPMPAFQTKV